MGTGTTVSSPGMLFDGNALGNGSSSPAVMTHPHRGMFAGGAYPQMGHAGMGMGMGMGIGMGMGMGMGMGAGSPDALMLQLRRNQQMMLEQMHRLQLQQRRQQRTARHSAPSTSNAVPISEDRLRTVFALVSNNALDEIMDLLDAGAVDPDVRDAGGNTPLMAACAAGHRRMTRQLLRRGANVNRRNEEGNTPLHFCVAAGHAELAAYLVSKGADERAKNRRGLAPSERFA